MTTARKLNPRRNSICTLLRNSGKKRNEVVYDYLKLGYCIST